MIQESAVVVNLRQIIDMRSAGKLALAAIANAKPTMQVTFCPLKIIPRIIATAPSNIVAPRLSVTWEKIIQ
jgi:hypothetical protein